jgi:hypothetical protein
MTLSEVRKRLPFQLERDYDDLTRPEQLNVQADHRATAALDELREADTKTAFYPIPTCRGYLCDSTGYVTSHEIRTLRTDLTEYELREYLQRRNDWSKEVYDSISWPAYRSASAGLTDSLRTFVVKFSHGW